MRHHILSAILLAAAIMSGGCTDDELQLNPGQSSVPGGQGESLLQLAVESYDVNVQNGARSAEPSGTPEPESPEEKRIQDFWMFQFKQEDGTQLATPKYYEIATGVAGKETLEDLTTTAYAGLTTNTPMTIYIVTNTHSSTWALDGTNTKAGFETLEGVKSQQLPSPMPIRAGRTGEKKEEILIPMGGQLDNVTVTNNTLVVVPVTRMFAKVKIKVDFNVKNMEMYYALVSDIPPYCRVTTENNGVDANGEPNAIPIPENTEMLSRAFNSTETVTDDTGTWMVIYVPENIRGEVSDADKTKNPAVNVPEKALAVNILAKYDGMNYYYTVYPGENNTNNFNVRRNCVYRIVADVTGATDQHTPSSNCFVVEPGDKLQFEPYNRVETGGGFRIEDYLNPDDEEKRIEKVEIVWQTKDCIGDNTAGDKVYLEKNYTGEEKYRKIIVHTQKEGNALVAARNKAGEIVWSWHIWVTPNQPDNLANAVVYTTYRWEKTLTTVKVKVDSTRVWWPRPHWEYTYEDREVEAVAPLANEPRIPGYSVMPCNLGALDFIPTALSPKFPGTPGGGNNVVSNLYASTEEDLKFKDEYRTFGMVYQWGRKDPFPPVYYFTGGNNDGLNSSRLRPVPGYLNYTDFYTGYHYANDNTKEVKKTAYFHPDYIGKLDYEVDTLFYSVFNGELPNTSGSGIKYGIKNPTVYIASSRKRIIESLNDITNHGDWLPEGQSNDELWGGLKPNSSQKHMEIDNDADGNIIRMFDNYGDQKSIFDPCPTGWRVAPGELWLGFTITGKNPDNYGVTANNMPGENDTSDLGQKVWGMPDVNWDKKGSGKNGMLMYMQYWRDGQTSYFPLQGTRVGMGFWYNNGWCGNYHNATCSMNNRVNILHMHQNSLRMHIFENTNREYYIKSTASPVRCVRDRK